MHLSLALLGQFKKVKIIEIDFCMEVKFPYKVVTNLDFQSNCVPSVYPSVWNIIGAQKYVLKDNSFYE